MLFCSVITFVKTLKTLDDFINLFSVFTVAQISYDIQVDNGFGLKFLLIII